MIDFFAMHSSLCDGIKVNQVLDIEPNFSDHLPVMVSIISENLNHLWSRISDYKIHSKPKGNSEPQIKVLRWDHCDKMSYYFNTYNNLYAVNEKLNLIDDKCVKDCLCSHKIIPKGEHKAVDTNYELCNAISEFYSDIVLAFKNSAVNCVPLTQKNFYKYWWDQELDSLKDESIAAHEAWKCAGKPRSGEIFEHKKLVKSLYKQSVRDHKRRTNNDFNNNLHQLLLRKDPTAFWKTWKSKFRKANSLPKVIDGSSDEAEIANKFGDFFASVCSGNSASKAVMFKNSYNTEIDSYTGDNLSTKFLCSVELVDKVVSNLKLGKAAGLDGLTTEHVLYSHPIIITVLKKLFNLMIAAKYVPIEFGFGLSVPIPKDKFSAKLSDYRCITISPVLTKIFELCIGDILGNYLYSSDHQLGFKQKTSCAHAVYAVRETTD